ncbi:hypothetical protein [Corynebacterium freneyi]|uniref:Uncharacterized protein n=1 Tax=Corynebacterium freneyi TaxID=134034 RepID=A0ABS4U967_9CORY|nr:hypothetical protein [Corynebacterium freneyi]MBP2333071.1 hypothetical protein [Corynebacterium freneyi]QXA52834.1 hypothetical protein I6L56_12640 [Corynebacterium freneyi]WJZ04827.1 hypothetical protein CFREN_04245 [Corynebacterium freneyi]
MSNHVSVTGTFQHGFGRVWEVHDDRLPIDPNVGRFSDWADALAYAHRRATTAQRQHVEKLERHAYEARTAALKARPKPRVKINITAETAAGAAELAKAQARIEAHERFRACYGR